MGKQCEAALNKVSSPVQAPTVEGKPQLTMYRSNMDLNDAISAVMRLEYVPWQALAGRPEPGLSLGFPTPAVSDWTAGGSGGQYSGLAGQYEAACLQAREDALAAIPAALAMLLTDGAPSPSTSNSSPSGSGKESQENPEWMQDLSHGVLIPNSTSHAWRTSPLMVKELVARLAVLRLKAAAMRMALATQAAAAPLLAAEGGEVAAAAEEAESVAAAELESAAAAVVAVARLMHGAEGRDLALEVHDVMQTLGRSLPLVSSGDWLWRGR